MNKPTVQWGLIALALVLAVATGWQSTDWQDDDQSASRASNDPPFDFYVLALSWSPAFCATDAGKNSPTQCGSGADFGFITHGLWPQFESGWPSFCQSPHGDRMPSDIATALLPIMPDRRLIAHQWDKHGTCAGLDQQSYARQIAVATDSIAIPSLFEGPIPGTLDARIIEQAFQQANPAIPHNGIAISCPNGRFAEVRICLDQNLSPRTCEEVDRQGCQQTGLQGTPR